MNPRHLGPMLVPCLLALAGCAGSRAQLHRALESLPPPTGRDLEAEYVVRCPDVLDVRVTARPDRSGTFAVGPDGGIAWPGRPHVAGLSAPRIASTLARELRVGTSDVRVRVAEYRSQHV